MIRQALYGKYMYKSGIKTNDVHNVGANYQAEWVLEQYIHIGNFYKISKARVRVP